MPLFDNENSLILSNQLIQRIAALRLAVSAGDISVDELREITDLSTADLDEALKNQDGNPALEKLEKILFHITTNLNVDETLLDGLKEFDKRYANYLPLHPLASENRQTLKTNLNEFAKFYLVFIQFVEAIKSDDETCTLRFNTPAAKNHWLNWESTRPVRIDFNKTDMGFPGLFEKFIAGTIRSDEWLTDEDLRRAFRILDLKKASVLAIPFNTVDVGMALHFEREKHNQDDPKQSYVIPLIVNLGSNALHQQGVHWARVLITVDPTKTPTAIKCDYTDTLALTKDDKKNIEKTLKKAIQFYEQTGELTKHDAQIFSAFPDCENPEMSINGTAEQRDGYTCGYRALQGIIRDLVNAGVLEDHPILKCKEASELRDFVYQTLIGQQTIPQKTVIPKELKEPKESVITPELVHGLLLSFSTNAPAKLKSESRHDHLRKLANREKIAEQFRQLDVIKALSESNEKSLTVDLQAMLDNKEVKAINNPQVAMEEIFKLLRTNPALNDLKIKNATGYEDSVLQLISSLPLHVNISTTDETLKNPLSIIRARNDLILSYKIPVTAGEDLWAFLFQQLLYPPAVDPQLFKPSSKVFDWIDTKMGTIGFGEFLNYLGNNETRFSTDFPYHLCSLGNKDHPVCTLDMLEKLSAHLQSDQAFQPFETFAVFLSKSDYSEKMLQERLFSLIDNDAYPPLTGIEIHLPVDEILAVETIKAITKHLGTTPLVISFPSIKNPQLTEELKALENKGLENLRAKKSSKITNEKIPNVELSKPVTLGKIGRAIFEESAYELETQVQQQQEQQQQMQQQVQTSSVDDDLPDQDELKEERYSILTKPGPLVTRQTLEKDVRFKQYSEALPHKPKLLDAWDLITGEQSIRFKNGIKSMTYNAFTKLMDHLEDVQYGLHPDHLPLGFSLQQDTEEKIILDYNEFDQTPAQNETPLTIRFSKPMANKTWQGDALQFMTHDQAKKLYEDIYTKNKKQSKTSPPLADCISNHFYIKGDKTKPEEKLAILKGILNGMGLNEDAIKTITNQINNLFAENKNFSKRIESLSQVLYEKGPEALSNLLDKFETIKGKSNFQSFEQCFLNPSQNWTELTDKPALDAMEKLMTLSSAQLNWWIALTEQHTSNRLYKTVNPDENIGDRWSSLPEMLNGFFYFCVQMTENYPDLTLPDICPLTGVADMRVGLDRLLTILDNALDAQEQFNALNPASYDEGYFLSESKVPLKSCYFSLDALGPFYASRYEGFKLVTPDMMLKLGTLSGLSGEDITYSRTEKTNYRSKCSFREIALLDKTSDKKCYFLRYIATMNHRLPIEEYQTMFDTITKKLQQNKSLQEIMRDYILSIVYQYGSSKGGTHYTEKDINDLFDLSTNHQDSMRAVFSCLTESFRLGLRCQLKEIVDFSRMIVTNHQSINMNEYLLNIWHLKPNEVGEYFKATLLLNKKDPTKGMTLRQFIETSNKIITAPPPEKEKITTNPIKIPTIRLLAICSPEGLTNDNIGFLSDELHKKVETCFEKHGESFTLDLLALLGSIDGNINPPSLSGLTNLIETVTSEEKSDFSQLRMKVTASFRDCHFRVEQLKTSAPESGGTLASAIKKFMPEIKKELAPFAGMIGENFLTSLDTPAGPQILISQLEKIKQARSVLNDLALKNMISMMKNIYQSEIEHGIKTIEINDASLTTFMNSLRHQTLRTNDFNAFIGIFPKELECLSKLVSSLKLLKKKWPAQFKEILESLDKNYEALANYPLVLVENLIGLLAKNINETNRFPTHSLEQLLSFKNIKEETGNRLYGIIDQMFQMEPSLNHEETTHCLELATTCCLKDPDDTSGVAYYLQQAMSESRDIYYTKKSTYALAAEGNLAENQTDANTFIDFVKELNNEALAIELFSFFSKDRAKEFLPFMKRIHNNPSERAVVMSIFLNAANRSLKAKEVIDYSLVDDLFKLEPGNLKLIQELYQIPRAPSIAFLRENLGQLKNLIENCDKDPCGTRKKSGELEKQFDTSEVANYLDHLEDMNHHRTMLLSQRKELQEWFLYINAIGLDKPIALYPNCENAKTIKNMSHAEMTLLLDHYKQVLADDSISPKKRIKTQLETIAILREAMFRTTDKFPRPTQVLYLLASIQQKGKNLVCEIPTGQGKSVTAALMAAFATVEGKTVDITTANPNLARQCFEETEEFYHYLKIPVRLLGANSSADTDKGVTITTLPELALYRSKMELTGKVFPENSLLIADEVDFSSLDDDMRYRFAKSLDPVTEPYKSPYIWIYEHMIDFVDQQKEKKSDEDLMKEANIFLNAQANMSGQKKSQLKKLISNPTVYNERLKTWLMAAAISKDLMKKEMKNEGSQFRVQTLAHPQFPNGVSKACIMKNQEPQFEPERSKAVQQFLHLRLRKKSKEAIDAGKMPDFLVEPESAYITSLNSKIMQDKYERVCGMTGTAGSPSEIAEQHAKYGTIFMKIPPFQDSKRHDLKPILTNPTFLNDSQKEENNHINLIVKEIIHHIRSEKKGLCSPVLVHCPSREYGEKMKTALKAALGSKYQDNYSTIQGCYGSEKPTPKEREDDERKNKEIAGKNGTITFSTTYRRGTDIKPEHTNGLYSIVTSVEEPGSTEDLERSKRQKIGRSGRASDKGFSRMIIRRSEFKDCYTPKQIRNIKSSNEALDDAIADLNGKRNQIRAANREERELFDDIKDYIYKRFSAYIKDVNDSELPFNKSELKNHLLNQWQSLSTKIDDYYSLLENDGDRLTHLATYACAEWNKLASGALKNHSIKGASELKWHDEKPLEAPMVMENAKKRHSSLSRQYVKRQERFGRVDPTLSPEAVYSDFMAEEPGNTETNTFARIARKNATTENIKVEVNYLNHKANAHFIKGKFKFSEGQSEQEKTTLIMGSLLYLRYKAHANGNPLTYTAMSTKCREFAEKIIWSKDKDLIDALHKAETDHFNRLTDHRGEHEASKGTYLGMIRAESRQRGGNSTQSSSTWWKQTGKTPLIDGLTNYKDKWWTRSFVSDDRKAIVKTLLIKLIEKDLDGKTILQYISEARKTLLENDASKNRSLDSSLNGRLFNYLNEMEVKIRASMTPEELDEDITREFTDMTKVLEQINNHLNFHALTTVIENLNDKTLSDEKKILSILNIFNQVSQMDPNAKRFKKNDWKTFYHYCHQKQSQLVNYLSQCKEKSELNEKGSIAVFQAASEAGAVVLDKARKSSSNVLVESINYKNKKIECEYIENSNLLGLYGSKYVPFFYKINNPDTYNRLLKSLERFIIEKFPKGTALEFNKITLDKSEQFDPSKGSNPSPPGFVVNVLLTIDGKEETVAYHFDINSGEMYCDNSKLLTTIKKPEKKEEDLKSSYQDLDEDIDFSKLEDPDNEFLPKLR